MPATTPTRAQELKRRIFRVMTPVFDSILTHEERRLKDFVLMLVAQVHTAETGREDVLATIKPYDLPEDIATAFLAAALHYNEKLSASPDDCTHMTQKGNRCRNAAIPGFNCCGTHLGR